MAKNKESKLTKEQIDNIKGYNDQIKTLESFIQAIQLRPTMYIGSRGSKGFLNMGREIFQNGIDQIMMANGICNTIIVSYDENSKTFIIEDNGFGIPFNNIVRIFSSQHTGKNFEKKEGDFSSGTFGTGSKATNALSNYFLVRSYILGEGREMRFEKGIPVYEDEKIIPNDDNKQGTVIEFQVNEEIMGDCELSWEIPFTLFSVIMSLAKTGSALIFNAVTKSGEVINECFINKDGIATELINKTTKPLIKPIFISEYTGEKTVDLVFTYDSEDLDVEDITSYANMSPTTGGTHVNGFLDGLCQFFRNYMNKIYLAGNKKNKLVIINNDVKVGLKAMIHVKHINPDLEGQSKERLTNSDVQGFVKDVTIKQLDEWSKNNAGDLQKLCKYIKDVAEIRVKNDKSKEKIINKYNTSSIIDLPPKYEKPSVKDKSMWEFWIVEGDSAGGSAVNGRMAYQGILPIRGKMPNAFTTKREKFLNNEEVKAFFAIVNAGIGKNFDINKVEWSKIIIGADADVDGLHISTLILQMVMLYAPAIIEHGLLYRAVPPLFGINKGTEKKPKFVYYTDESEYIKYVQGLFSKDNIIQTLKNAHLNNKELEYILNVNLDYTYTLENIANRYSLDAQLLEDIVLNSDLNFKQLYNNLHSKYKYLNIDNRQGTTIIDGLVNNKINTIYLTERFFEEIKAIKEIINKNQFTSYKLNGNIVSLYQLMSTFNTYKPTGVERYKGLGEMDADQLKDSTLNPNNRTLVRYTMASAKEEIDRVRYLESNKYELIAGTSATRHDL